ncbi:MAG: phosphoribosylformylglycinamidine synthase I [Candidatus Peregrinibacteria bacterium]|nr:phosphoribosylformylglycinamidine synthase I [Candidatus Peregrinibacteria bacterium]
MNKCAVVAFPGNNCEVETSRAATRNGFETTIFLWNQIEEFKAFNPDFIILPGGFSFEDRGRSGVLASKAKIFDVIREFAKKGTVILGICNGAQMVVESALIPLEIALAKNVRRDDNGHVLGTGFYNEWVYLKPENKNSAFTKFVKNNTLKVPVAHGEGRFVTREQSSLNKLESGENVAFRYCDEEGNVSPKFPITPNGSNFAVAGICNTEGTVCAMMPHPERFFDNCDGDQILKSVYQFIEAGEAPSTVEIGDFTKLKTPEIHEFSAPDGTTLLEKKLIITDNENFSVRAGACSICNTEIDLEKSILFEITGDVDSQKLIDSGLILNENKEFLLEKPSSTRKLAVKEYEDDEADHLSDQLTEMFGTDIKVKLYKCWDFGSTSDSNIENIIESRLLANPNSAEIFEVK